MKKTLLILCVFIFSLTLWWLLGPGPQDYTKTPDADISFETVLFRSSDPKRLSDFYKNTFLAKETETIPEWILGKTDSSPITLRTPGYLGEGPYLTILKAEKPALESSANDLGYAHICFETDNVPGLIHSIRKNGGKIDSNFEDLEKVPAIYGKDPDGNVFEIHIPFPTPLSPSTIFRSLNSFVRTRFKFAPPETDRIRFLHVNINSKDWSKALSFYGRILEASPTGFERDYQGDFIENLTGLKGIRVQGRHLPLPGYSEGGPTFEIFTYNRFSKRGPLQFSDTGRVAVGFRVSDVNALTRKILQEGGTLVKEKEGDTAILQDPEGNLFLLAPKKSKTGNRSNEK